ncbi:carbohydrate binding domain protein [[Clostridium] bifermentans ATCC 19299]|nr:immunoglobulin-like domain-containing protein [Paraclostridium bifermentans]EQK40343.1 carbohydrate binding domain protein [[Clostridium] bifermentans ATCC 19299] [Paraclostridium bifermentans ATCC 19299]
MKHLKKLNKKIVFTLMVSMIMASGISMYDGIKVNAQENKTTNISYSNKSANFGVGQGIEWPTQVNAPYVDMVAWITKPGYTNNGTVNLKRITEDSGVKFFNLGFIQSTGKIENNKVKWGWGGFSVLNEDNNDNTQYQGMKQSIKELRDIGGDVTIAFGGLNGVTFWEQTQDVNVLYNTYKEIVDGYGLTRIDLDIEGGAAQSKALNITNAKAIKKVQDETGVDVVLTLPVLPSGLTSVQLDVLEAYLSQGVDIELVNIMTMCYGNGTLLPGENYGTASIRAIDNTKNQVQQYFKKYANISLTDSEAYKKVGTTSSIGFEGEAHPIFGTDWAKLVVDHSIEKGLGMTSFWSMNRDAMLETNKGVTSQYQFTDIYKTFGEGAEPGDPQQNQAPTLHGIDNKTIYVGDKFDELEGVSAADREDGDLTSKIKVEGKVDTTKAGDYKISYSVADSEGLTTNKQRTITVKEKPDPSQDTYDSNKIYLEGDSVVFKGEKYVAKWWVKGEDPDKSQAWQKIVTPNEDGSIDYYEGLVCQGGELVRYNGHTYKAKWWTNTTPGSDDTWELIK